MRRGTLLVGFAVSLAAGLPAATQQPPPPRFGPPEIIDPSLLGGSPKTVATADDDERLLESAGLASSGPGLLEIFRARARIETEPGRVDDLVRRLIGPSLEDR